MFRRANKKKIETEYTLSPEFIRIGDTILMYTIKPNARSDSIDLMMNFPIEIINENPSTGLSLDETVVSCDSLPLGRLDSVYFYIQGVLSPITPVSNEIIVIVDEKSNVKESTDHHLLIFTKETPL